jgi:DNA-3-methyladenine glycosylase II
VSPGGPTRRPTHLSAARELAARDAVMAELYRSAGAPRLRPPELSHFAALVRSVLYQQLAGAAAAAIHARLVAVLAGEVVPEAVLALTPESLRSAGLSGAKAATITDLASKVLDGTVVLDPRRIARETDEEVIGRLSAVRGIGRWTAQMFLIFQLRRLDVWPAADLGVRRGYGLAYGLAATPSERQLEPLGDAFRPYRSVAAWYCWRANERYAGAARSVVTA